MIFGPDGRWRPANLPANDIQSASGLYGQATSFSLPSFARQIRHQGELGAARRGEIPDVPALFNGENARIYRCLWLLRIIGP